jgi:hypothetical protein
VLYILYNLQHCRRAETNRQKPDLKHVVLCEAWQSVCGCVVSSRLRLGGVQSSTGKTTLTGYVVELSIHSTEHGGLLRTVALRRVGLGKPPQAAQDAWERDALVLRVIWDVPAFDVCKSKPVCTSVVCLFQQPGYH